MNTKTQEHLSVTWLITRGYTVAAAARKIGYSTNHVWAVLKNKRSSSKVCDALQALPERDLVLREKLVPTR